MSVNFICVGAQKAGTTAFFDIIKEHPDVCMSSKKEVHFFDIDKNYSKGKEWYDSFFIDKTKKIIGECTPDYLLYNYIPKRIKDTLGINVKLLFILRNPIDRAYSQYNFHIMKGVEFRDNFLDVIYNEKLDKLNSDYTEWHNPTYYIPRGYYYNQINRFLQYFPKENMHFVLYEELFGIEQKHYIKKIIEFLGITEFNVGEVERANPSMTPKSGVKKSILTNLRKNNWILKGFKKLLPNKLYFFIREKILFRLQKRPEKLDENLKIELNNKFFKEDIILLEKLIKKDLSNWLK